jgi:tetratricopeptide (TPR) repeat protein
MRKTNLGIIGSWLGLFLSLGMCIPLPAAETDTTAAHNKVEVEVGKAAKTVSTSLVDQPLADYQQQLLDVAFRAASAMPLKIHIKNRSRAQEKVIGACLKMDQPRRALEYIQDVKNWRKGVGYADLAYYCVQHELGVEEVPGFLEQAELISTVAEGWRSGAIRIKIARTHSWMGQPEEAKKFQTGVEVVDASKMHRERAMQCTPEEAKQQLDVLREVVKSEHFEVTCNGLMSYTELFDRFYETPAIREQAEKDIRDSWSKVTVAVRIQLLTKMAEGAIAHEDRPQAMVYVGEIQEIIDHDQSSHRFHIPFVAAQAELRYRAGDRERARADLDAAYQLVLDEMDKIINIDRAGILRSIAQAYQNMGSTPVALEVYREAIEQGVVNINSRPRATDLSETCCSMAIHGVQPDAALWARIHQIHDELGPPW